MQCAGVENLVDHCTQKILGNFGVRKKYFKFTFAKYFRCTQIKNGFVHLEVLTIFHIAQAVYLMKWV